MNKNKIDTPERRARLLTELTMHVGKINAIGMGELYEAVFQRQWNNKVDDTRYIRQLITDLRNEGIAICSTMSRDGGGYYLAAAGSELSDYLNRLERRALRVLSRVSRTKKVSLPEYLGQMRLRIHKFK
jgi:hypothetical protein